MDLVAIREAFNLKLINMMSTSILQDSIFGWNGYGKTIFGVCFIIALFQSFTKGEREMLVEWTKITIASWFCLAILGQPQANFTKVFPFLEGQGGSLDIAVFNYAKGTFDSIGKEMSKKEGGPQALEAYTYKLHNTLKLFSQAATDCTPENIQCIRDIIQGNNVQNTEAEKKSGLTAIVYYLESAWNSIKQAVANPLVVLFPLFMVILQVIRGVVEMFVLISFGMITAIMLMLTKALCPLMLLPSYRGRIISLFKTTLSTSLYGFVSHLVLWLSIVITKALYLTTGEFFISQLNTGNSGDGMWFLLITNFFTSAVIIAMQAAAIAKIPKICKQIMNLSVEEIVNIGETLLQAGMGMAKMAGMATVGIAGMAAAAVAAPAAAGAAAMSGAGGALGAVGKGAMAMGKGIRAVNTGAQRLGFDGFLPGKGGGGGSPASQLLSMGKQMSGGGGGGSMALGDANSGSGAGGSSSAGTFLKKDSKIAKNAKNKPMAGVIEGDEDGEEKDSKSKGQSEIDGLSAKEKAQGGVLSTADKKERRNLKLLENTIGAAGQVIGGGKGLKGLMSVAAQAAEQGVMAGMGSGDGAGWVGGVSKNLSSKEAQSTAARIGESLAMSKRATAAERGAVAELALDTIGSGPAKMDQASEASYEYLQKQVSSGNASEEDMYKFVQMGNKFELSQENQKTRDTLIKEDRKLAALVKREQAIDQKLIRAVSEGKATDKQLVEFASRADSGMMNIQSLQGNNTLKASLGNITSSNFDKALTDIEKRKSDSGGQISQEDRQQLSLMTDTSSRAMIGNNATLDRVNNASGGTIDVDHLRMDRTRAAQVASDFASLAARPYLQSRALGDNDPGQTVQLSPNLGIMFEGGQITAIQVDGIVVTNDSEFQKVNKNGAGYQELMRFSNANEIYANDFETRNQVQNPFRKKALEAGSSGPLAQFLKKVNS